MVRGAESKSLTQGVWGRRQVIPIFVENLKQAREMIEAVVEENDVLVFLGAGSISSLARDFIS